MKQSGHLNPSEETGTGCPVTSKYGRTPPNIEVWVDNNNSWITYISHRTFCTWQSNKAFQINIHLLYN